MRTYSIELNEAHLHMVRKLVCDSLRKDGLTNHTLTNDQTNLLCEILDAVTAEKVYA